MVDDVIAPCGLNCSRCAVHRAPGDPALMARVIIRAQKERGLSLAPDKVHCGTCYGDLVDHWSPNCNIRMCCVDVKRHSSCSHCHDFPCGTLMGWCDGDPRRSEAFQRLKRLRREKP
jgi:hypothetical protein